MGRPGQPSFASRLGCELLAFSWLGVASAQVPVQGPPLPAGGPPPGDAPPAPPPPAAPLPAPPAAPPAASAAQPVPPPLDPPPPPPPSTGPSFLKRPEAADASHGPGSARSEPRRLDQALLPKDFALSASPWVDFTFTNFWFDERASNFLNLGVQVGGYFYERLRVTARLVAPLEEAEDEYHDYGYSYSTTYGYGNTRSPSIALLYGASLGLIIANARGFVFAPGLLLMRADVNDYGTVVLLELPFEWTTRRRLRTGFELAIGHAFGGEAGAGAGGRLDRPGGTSILLQYQMGFSVGHL